MDKNNTSVPRVELPKEGDDSFTSKLMQTLNNTIKVLGENEAEKFFSKSMFPPTDDKSPQSSSSTSNTTSTQSAKGRPLKDLQIVTSLLHIFSFVIDLFNLYKSQRQSKYRSIDLLDEQEEKVILIISF